MRAAQAAHLRRASARRTGDHGYGREGPDEGGEDGRRRLLLAATAAAAAGGDGGGGARRPPPEGIIGQAGLRVGMTPASCWASRAHALTGHT